MNDIDDTEPAGSPERVPHIIQLLAPDGTILHSCPGAIYGRGERIAVTYDGSQIDNALALEMIEHTSKQLRQLVGQRTPWCVLSASGKVEQVRVFAARPDGTPDPERLMSIWRLLALPCQRAVVRTRQLPMKPGQEERCFYVSVEYHRRLTGVLVRWDDTNDFGGIPTDQAELARDAMVADLVRDAAYLHSLRTIFGYRKPVFQTGAGIRMWIMAIDARAERAYRAKRRTIADRSKTI